MRSIVVRFVSELNKATDRLLTIATADTDDANMLANKIIEELEKAGLNRNIYLKKISRQVC